MVELKDLNETVGKKVIKKSNRPFKSMFRKNTVKGVITHPVLGIPAYVFEEDDSYVAVDQCEIIE